MVSCEAGEHEWVESGLTTFLTVSPLYDQAHKGLTLLGDLCQRQSDRSEAKLVEGWGGESMKWCDGGVNRDDVSLSLIQKRGFMEEQHGSVPNLS
jgi:hypothetical protein